MAKTGLLAYLSYLCRTLQSTAPNRELRTMRLALLLAGLLTAASAVAEPPTLHWSVPLPAGHSWRIVDLREGNGIRHEDYIPRGQGTEDYRDRILVQRLQAQELNPETYLAHVSDGLRAHCTAFTTSGLVPSGRDGLPGATLTAYCGRFDNRPYGYIIAHKAIRDGNHLFVVEREWRLPPFAIDETGLVNLNFGNPAEDAAIKKEIHFAVRWLIERVQPGQPTQPEPAPTPPSRRKP